MRTPAFRTITFACLCALSILILSCKKKSDTPVTSATYSSLADFYAKNGVQSQFFNVDAVAGGSFTTPQGTKVTISPNSFVDLSNNPVSGTVRIEFKDIYKKSDMLMTDIPPMLGNGAPLVSGGEFFIRAQQTNSADSLFLNLAKNKFIVVQQPLNGKPDTAMKPFVLVPDSTAAQIWQARQMDTVSELSNGYVFALYNFSSPVGKGTWCNSDNSTYFSAYKNTTLTLIPDFTESDYSADVFLIFKGLNSMVHIYYDGVSQFPYYYAPIGLSCTVVVVGTKNNNLYGSFTPITISANQTVNIPISQITTADFKNKLTALDN